MIEKVITFRCTQCGKIFEQEVDSCHECSTRMYKGKRVGSFRFIEKLAITGKLRVECLLCGFEKDISQTNIKRQRSCGCKPRHIEINSVTEDKIRYFCRRCSTNTVEELPLFTWCCDEELDE